MKKGQLRKQVLKILEDDEKSRNSDIRLTMMLWWHFYQKYMVMIEGEVHVKVTDLFNLPREDNIKRIRAKIQNEEHMFLPTKWEVAKKRKFNEQEWRKWLGYDN